MTYRHVLEANPDAQANHAIATRSASRSEEEAFDPDGDCRKNGDDMLPTGALLLVRLKMFVALIEKLTAYGRWTGGFAGGF